MGPQEVSKITGMPIYKKNKTAKQRREVPTVDPKAAGVADYTKAQLEADALRLADDGSGAAGAGAGVGEWKEGEDYDA